MILRRQTLFRRKTGAIIFAQTQGWAGGLFNIAAAMIDRHHRQPKARHGRGQAAPEPAGGGRGLRPAENFEFKRG